MGRKKLSWGPVHSSPSYASKDSSNPYSSSPPPYHPNLLNQQLELNESVVGLFPLLEFANFLSFLLADDLGEFLCRSTFFLSLSLSLLAETARLVDVITFVSLRPRLFNRHLLSKPFAFC